MAKKQIDYGGIKFLYGNLKIKLYIIVNDLLHKHWNRHLTSCG